MDRAARTTAILMTVMTVFMGYFVYIIAFEGGDPLGRLGFRNDVTNPVMSWSLALAIPLAYVAFCRRIPAVREWMIRPHWLKLLAVAMAFVAAILEELLFRELGFRWLASAGAGPALQIIGTGLAFGLAHAVWGLLKGRIEMATGAVLTTSALGLALSFLYWLSGYNLAPCIVAHFLVTMFIEPGLLLAAFSGQLGNWKRN